MKLRKYKIFICKQCNRKRWIYDLGYKKTGLDTYHVWECSKGHHWENKILRTEEIVNIMKEVFVDNVKNLFDRDDIFYKSIRR